jgi:hypothetical protein
MDDKNDPTWPNTAAHLLGRFGVPRALSGRVQEVRGSENRKVLPQVQKTVFSVTVFDSTTEYSFRHGGQNFVIIFEVSIELLPSTQFSPALDFSTTILRTGFWFRQQKGGVPREHQKTPVRFFRSGALGF